MEVLLLLLQAMDTTNGMIKANREIFIVRLRPL